MFVEVIMMCPGFGTTIAMEEPVLVLPGRNDERMAPRRGSRGLKPLADYIRLYGYGKRTS